jgi:hypothetical protein
MKVERVLHQAVDRIRSGQLNKEQQVKLAVIQPILRALDWDDADPSEVVAEFSVPDGSVDYALLGTTGSPLVFLEAKRLDHADEKGVDQVFRYAANRGVPFLILTDGNIWDFYLSMADGIPIERRFYRIELQRDDKIGDYAAFFEQYLRKNRVSMHETRIAAEQLRDSDRQREKARTTIGGVWRTLVSTPDESLCNLLAEAVEVECGTKPELDDVDAYLRGISFPSSATQEFSPTSQGQSTLRDDIAPETPDPIVAKKVKITGFVLGDGPPNETGNGIRTLAELIREFDRRDSGFMERFASQATGRKRRLVAKDRDSLYDEVRLRDYAADLGNGWWLGTNLSTGAIKKHIGTACSVMGLQLGLQVTLLER